MLGLFSLDQMCSGIYPQQETYGVHSEERSH